MTVIYHSGLLPAKDFQTELSTSEGDFYYYQVQAKQSKSLKKKLGVVYHYFKTPIVHTVNEVCTGNMCKLPSIAGSSDLLSELRL